MVLGGIDSLVSTILWILLPVDIQDISRDPGVCTLGTKVSLDTQRLSLPKVSFLSTWSFSQMRAPEGRSKVPSFLGDVVGLPTKSDGTCSGPHNKKINLHLTIV